MSEESSAQTHRVRVFYHWKKPDEKERHGFAMGVVEARERTPEAIIEALREKHPKLREFVVFIDKHEWR
jgi:ribosomal protein L19E